MSLLSTTKQCCVLVGTSGSSMESQTRNQRSIGLKGMAGTDECRALYNCTDRISTCENKKETRDDDRRVAEENDQSDKPWDNGKKTSDGNEAG